MTKKQKPKKQIIEFKTSKSGLTFIDLDDMGKLIFSRLTSHPEKGYKYLCFTHEYIDVIPIKNTTGKRKTINVPTNDSYTVNIKLERKTKSGNTKAVGLPHNTLPGRMKDYLKKNIIPLLDDDGYLSYRKIDILKRKINGRNIQTILNRVQKKRKKRKKSTS